MTIDYLAIANFQQQLDPNFLSAVGYLVGATLAGFFGSLVQKAFSKKKMDKDIEEKVESRVNQAQEPQNEKLTDLENKYNDLKTFSDGQQLVNNELREARELDAKELQRFANEIVERDQAAKKNDERIKKVEDENIQLRTQLHDEKEHRSRLELEMAGLRGQLSVYEFLLKPFLADLANSIVRGNGASILKPALEEAESVAAAGA